MPGRAHLCQRCGRAYGLIRSLTPTLAARGNNDSGWDDPRVVMKACQRCGRAVWLTGMCAKRGDPRVASTTCLGWQFTYTIGSPPSFTQTYRLSRIDTSTGTRLIVGTDQYGDPVVAGRIQDVNPGNPLLYEFGLLEPSDFLICRFFVFNKTGSNSVEGFYFQIDVRNGVCGTAASDISNPYPMTGIRTSRSTSSIQGQSTPQDTVLEQPNAGLQSLEETSTLSLSSPDEADSAAIRDMINTLSSALD